MAKANKEKEQKLSVQEDNWDWEVEGSGEMNDLYSELSLGATILGVRDSLNTIKDVIALCGDSLETSELMNIKECVNNILHFIVYTKLEEIDKELASICNH